MYRNAIYAPGLILSIFLTAITVTDSDTAAVPATTTAANSTTVTVSAAVSTVRELKEETFFSRGQQPKVLSKQK